MTEEQQEEWFARCDAIYQEQKDERPWWDAVAAQEVDDDDED